MDTKIAAGLTASRVVEVASLLCSAAIDFFHLLSLTALVEVFDDDTDEHVEHEETDEQQERDEVDQTPLVVVDLRLHNVDDHYAIILTADNVRGAVTRLI